MRKLRSLVVFLTVFSPSLIAAQMFTLEPAGETTRTLHVNAWNQDLQYKFDVPPSLAGIGNAAIKALGALAWSLRSSVNNTHWIEEAAGAFSTLPFEQKQRVWDEVEKDAMLKINRTIDLTEWPVEPGEEALHSAHLLQRVQLLNIMSHSFRDVMSEAARTKLDQASKSLNESAERLPKEWRDFILQRASQEASKLADASNARPVSLDETDHMRAQDDSVKADAQTTERIGQSLYLARPSAPVERPPTTTVAKFFLNYSLIKDWARFQEEQSKLLSPNIRTVVTDHTGTKVYFGRDGYFGSLVDWSKTFSTEPPAPLPPGYRPDFRAEIPDDPSSQLVVRLRGTIYFKKPINGLLQVDDSGHAWTETFRFDGTGRIKFIKVSMNLKIANLKLPEYGF